MNSLGADQPATAEMMSLLYAQMRSIADRLGQGERAGHTLQPTALVHEAFLRLVTVQGSGWKNRRYFFGAAAETMRRVLVDRARKRKAVKRDVVVVEDALDTVEADTWKPDELLALDLALDKLSELSPVRAEVVKLRFFAGLTRQEVADTLEISHGTVANYWTYSRAWLVREIEGKDAP